MGVDIHVYILRHDRVDNHYNWIKIYNKNNEIIPVYDKKDYELFDILKIEGRSFISIPEICFDKDFYQEFKESENIGFYGWGMINLADLKIYANENPTIDIDYNKTRKSPLFKFINIIESYVELGDDEYQWIINKPSDIFIFFWFDH